MAGWLTAGFPQLSIFTGAEQVSLDTEISGGSPPQTAMSSLIALAVALKALANAEDKTTVAGSRYFVGVTLGNDTTLTGIQALVGSTGGTDKWIAELYDANGNLLATSATAGTTTGAAGLFQQFAFTAPYFAAAGNYFLAIQTNGTTAKLATLGAANLPVLTGSETGTFGTGAAITPPTTYTANLGPIATVY